MPQASRSKRNKPRGVKGTRVPDDSLPMGIQDLLAEARGDLGSFGWTIHVERRGKALTFEFRNPLSPVWSGWNFDEDRPVAQLEEDLRGHLNAEPEFLRTKAGTPPRRKRRLVGGLRWAATSYGWSDKVFREVIDTLRYFRTLARDEWEWLNAVGPHVLEADLERKWQDHVKEHPAPRPGGARPR